MKPKEVLEIYFDVLCYMLTTFSCIMFLCVFRFIRNEETKEQTEGRVENTISELENAIQKKKRAEKFESGSWFKKGEYSN